MLKKIGVVVFLPYLFIIFGCAKPPKIISNPQNNVKIAEQYSYQLKAEGTAPIDYYTQNGPAGLMVDEKSGLVEWEPVSLGSFNIVLGAKNKAGVDEQQYQLEVTKDEVYDKGLEWGRLLYKDYKEKADNYYVLKMVHFLIENPAFRDSKAFKLGFEKGLLEEITDPEIKIDFSDLIVKIYNASGHTDIYGFGYIVGKKLREDKIRLFDVGTEKRKNALSGKTIELAWKTGFAYGYAKDNVNEIHYAVRIYMALAE